jgi:hypothetical protein
MHKNRLGYEELIVSLRALFLYAHFFKTGKRKSAQHTKGFCRVDFREGIDQPQSTHN